MAPVNPLLMLLARGQMRPQPRPFPPVHPGFSRPPLSATHGPLMPEDGGPDYIVPPTPTPTRPPLMPEEGAPNYIVGSPTDNYGPSMPMPQQPQPALDQGLLALLAGLLAQQRQIRRPPVPPPARGSLIPVARGRFTLPPGDPQF